jgi:hypothetical protein
MRREALDAVVAPAVVFLILLCGAGGLDIPVAGRALPVLLSLAGLVWIGRTFFVAGERRRAGLFFSGVFLLFLLLAIYHLNPSYLWKENIGALPVDHIRFLPASAFPAGVSGVMLFYGLALAAGGLAMHLGARSADWLSMAVLAGAAVTAVAVLDQRLTPRLYPVYERTGFFSYENHYAAFANLTFPVALAYAERWRCRAFQNGKVSSPAVLLYVLAALSAGAVILSRSRAGMAVTGLIGILFLLRRARLIRNFAFASPPASRRIRIAGGLSAFILSAGFLFAGGLFRFPKTGWLGGELSFRLQIVKDTLSLWRNDLWWGTGPGSFAAVFPYYQTHPVDRYVFRHAHCEPAEFFASYGILGAAVLLAALALIFLSRPVRISRTEAPSFRVLEGTGFALALAGIALHSLVDFPLRHPLNALLTAVWVGILAGSFRGAVKAGEEQEKTQK